MGLYQNIQEDKVEDLNLRDPVLARSSDKVRDVVQAMRDQRLGCAILVDDDRKPVGMFTENMLTQIVAKDPGAIEEPVGDHSADHWPQVSLKDPVAAVLDALEIKNVRFLSVVDEAGRIAGLTGQKGLMEYVADHFPQVTVQRVGQKAFMKTREGA